MTVPVDLTQAPTSLYSKILMPKPTGAFSGGAQSFAFNESSTRLYTLSTANSPNGDLYVSWLDVTKNPPVRSSQMMTLLGFGHGQQLSVVTEGSVVWLWLECDSILASNGVGYGSKICRIPWTPGVTITSASPSNGMIKYNLQPGSNGNAPVVDHTTGRLLLKYQLNGDWFVMYDLDDVINLGSSVTPLGPPIKEVIHLGRQGLTVLGDYAYVYAGPAKATICADAPEVGIYYQNVWTGANGGSITTAGTGLPRREPEGITVQTIGGVHRLVYSFNCKADCTGKGEYLQSFYYVADGTPVQAPQLSVRSDNGIGGPLGCAEDYRVYAYDWGGTDRIGEITPIANLSWGRVRDDISNAQITTAGFGQDCCEMLDGLRSMRHELVIFRDGVRVWEGPITRIAYAYDSVEIEARDVMQYLYRRILRQGYNHTYHKDNVNLHHGRPATETINWIINSTLSPKLRKFYDDIFEPVEDIGGHDPNILQYLNVAYHSDDAHESRRVYPFSKTCFEEIDDLASNGGIDYTVTGRRISVWDTSYPISTWNPSTKKWEGARTEVMDERDFLATPVITEYGMSLATFTAVSDGKGFFGVDGGIDSYYGLVETLQSSYSSSSGPTQDAGAADRRLWATLTDLQAAYYERRARYLQFPGLSTHEASQLAAWTRERNTPGVKPERQKTLDALIKPLKHRADTKAAYKTQMNNAYKKYKNAVKQKDQIINYVAALTTQAVRNRKGRNPAPVSVRIPDNTMVNPNAMIGINELIPGVWIPLRARTPCRTMTQWQKLDNVGVTFAPDTGEQVTVTMSPAPQHGADPDAADDPDSLPE